MKFAPCVMFVAATLLQGSVVQAAPKQQDNSTKTSNWSCVVFAADGTCAVNSKEAKGNDNNWLVTPEQMADFCLYRATTNSELKWCSLLGFR